MLIQKNRASIVLRTILEAQGLAECKAAVCGGYVRDMMHKKNPKDMDVELYATPETRFHIDEVQEDYIDPITEHLECVGASFIEVYTEYEGSCNDANVCFVIKTHIEGIDVDIIMRQDRPQTVEELFKGYDMSLNQCALNVNGHLNYNPACQSKVVVPTGKMISIDRLDRMKHKYPEYDFSEMTPFIDPFM